MSQTRFVRSASIPAVSSKARRPPICQCCNRPNSSSSSIFKRPERSASRCRHNCSPSPTIAARRRGGCVAAARDAGGRISQKHPPATGFAYIVDPFRQGLNDAGFVEGKNVAIEYRWADNQEDRLPGLAADLMRRQVAAIVGAGVPAAQAGKAATTTTPIVFVIGADPVRVGLVASINRPGGNITCVVFSVTPLLAKLLGMLDELVPKASIIAVLRDPNGPDVEGQSRDLEEAARAIGRQILMVNAANEREFHAAFAKVVQAGAGGLLIPGTVFFFSQRRQLVALAARHALPTVYNLREY